EYPSARRSRPRISSVRRLSMSTSPAAFDLAQARKAGHDETRERKLTLYTLLRVLVFVFLFVRRQRVLHAETEFLRAAGRCFGALGRPLGRGGAGGFGGGAGCLGRVSSCLARGFRSTASRAVCDGFRAIGRFLASCLCAISNFGAAGLCGVASLA